MFEEAGRPVSPAESRALSGVAPLDKGAAGGQMLVGSIPNPDSGTSSSAAHTEKHQQKILWAEVRKQTGRSKNRFKIQDLSADESCSQAILDFLSDILSLTPSP